MADDSNLNDESRVDQFRHSLDQGASLVRYPPMPLVSGEAFVASDGIVHLADSVSLVLKAGDGTSREVPLAFRQGGWWPPSA